MQILYVGGRLFYWRVGGVATVERSIVHAFSKDPRIKVSLIGTTPSNASNQYAIGPNTTVRSLPTGERPDSVLDILMSSFGYPILVRRARFDLAHFGILPGLRGAALLIYLKFKERRLPIVATVHGLPAEVKSYSDSAFKHAIGLIHWKISLWLLRYADKVIANSKYVADELEALSFSRSRIAVIPNGVEARLLSTHVPEVSENTIICFGRFYPLKGQHRLIMAFHIARCSSSFKLEFVGGPDNAYRRGCVRLTESLGLKDSITFTDFLAGEALFERVVRSSFCVFPSAFEGFGLGILESMALGKAVIGPEVGGPKDFIVSGVNGLMVDTMDIKALANAMDYLAFNQAKRAQLGMSARETASAYSWDKVASKYKDLYSEVTIRRGRSHGSQATFS